MRMMTLAAAAACASMSTAALADERVELASALVDEMATRRMTCSTPYGSRESCGNRNTCNETVEAITDFRVDLAVADTQKRAIYRWWRLVSGDLGKAMCMRELLGSPAYCRAVNLVAKFDPHQNCPSEGTNATCWVNRAYERSPLLLGSAEGDWYHSCQLDEAAE